MFYDIAIIGSGPAGSTLARLLNKKYKVFLIDQRDFNKSQCSFKKCCGGLLAPDAQKIMAELSLSLPKDVLVDPQIFAVKTIDLQNNLENFYQRFYVNFDREKFDRYLVSLIPSNIKCEFGMVFKKHKKVSNGFELELFKDGKILKEKCKVLIFANGAVSGRLNIKQYIAIQEWFESSKASPYFSAIFDSKITDFYSWIIPKDNYLLIGSALENDKNANDKFELLKEKLKKHGFQFSKKIKREGAMINRPVKLNQIYLGENNIGLIGEATGFISSSSAEGISYAFRSAQMMAQALNENFDNFLPKYKRLTRNLRRNIFMKNLKVPFMYNGFLRKMVMKSNINSLKIDDVI